MPDRIIRRLNGPRGSALLALGMVAAPFAVAYSPLTMPPFAVPIGLSIVGSVIPITVYGALWMLSAALSWAAAFTDGSGRQRLRLDRAAWALFVGLLVVWALAYFIGWLAFLAGWPPAEHANQSYITAGIYAGVALFVAICSRGMPNRELEIEHRRRAVYRRHR